MITRRVRAIVRREYVQRVRTKWFLFTTLFVPLLMGGATILPGLLLEGDDDSGPRIAVVDRAEGRPPLRLAETLRSQGLEAEDRPAPDQVSEREVASRLEAGEFDAWVIAPPDVFRTRTVTVLTLGGLGIASVRRLETAIHEAILLSQLSASGVTPEDVEGFLRPAELHVRDLREGRGGPAEVYQGLGFFMALVLYMMFLVYGQMITRGVQEEKSSDIVEIMVSSVRPWEMMLGKIIGVGGVGLTQVAIWGFMVAGFLLFALASAAPAFAELGVDLAEFRFPVSLAVMAPIFFVLGYLLYAGLFAAAGAMLGSEQDIQQVMLPLVIPLVVPVLILPGVLDKPDAGWSVAASLFPFFAPILMLVRLSVGNVPLWQVLASVLLLVGSVYVAALVAGRIYRIGILMKGKPPNLPELMRWIRHG